MPPCSLPLAFDTHSLSSASDDITTIASTLPAHAPPPVAFAFVPPAVIDPILPTPPLPCPPPPLHPPISALPAPAPLVSPVAAIASVPHTTTIFASSAIVTAPASPTVITVAASVTRPITALVEPIHVNPNRHFIFWLSGVAGTGKSTIAQSIAEYCDSNNWLAASFFFSGNNSK
ncbi:hypothetical protein F5148DRAFT_1288277 [Russula earlei]|uniref:Uncharacterized protein n=1 Tax=Russula earlei TaxID=71964 RepID=A0ACC0TZW1_9AGAM|nr:hypothetical protein F5148DRAFT_1288277 [Russula earlei]